MKKAVDLNCDLGEGMGIEADIMPYITSANFACGYHAGDVATIENTVSLCQQHHVAIGAHPSFDDRLHFGRKEMDLPDAELQELVIRQIRIIMKAAEKAGAGVQHIKLHGALYNMAARDARMAACICSAIVRVDPHLVLYGLSGSALIAEGKKAGLRVMNEVFADRTYQSDGSLTPRSSVHALITDTVTAVQQVRQMVVHETVTTVTGETIPIEVDTICIHGDGATAIALAKAIRVMLEAEDILICHPSSE